MTPRQFTMLLWKELEEDRWFFYAGAAAFVVLPVFASTFSIGGDFLFITVLTLGSILAVLVGVGTACRDLRGGVETFWRSRPIDARRWLLIKYLIGLLVVLVIHAMALSAQFGVTAFVLGGFHFPSVAALLYNSFALSLIYSAAFLLGCLVRQAVPAAILSLAAVLLIYFLPLLIPAANWLSTYNLIPMSYGLGHGINSHLGAIGGADAWECFAFLVTQPHALSFMETMSAGSLVLALLACDMVRRDLRLRVDGRLMAWSLGGVGLLIFGAGASQLGNNLFVERIIGLGPVDPRQAPYPHAEYYVDSVELVGNRGVARLCTGYPWFDPNKPGQVRSIDLDLPSPINTDVSTTDINDAVMPALGPGFAWSPEIPDRIYFLHYDFVPPQHNGRYRDPTPILNGIAGDTLIVEDLHGQIIQELPLPSHGHYAQIVLDHARLYCLGGDATPMIVISLEDPDHPRVEKILAGSRSMYSFAFGPQEGKIFLPAVPGWSARQKLQACCRFSNQDASLDGDLLAIGHWSTIPIEIWRLTHLDDASASFERIGMVLESPLERLAKSVGLRPDYALKAGYARTFQVLLHDQLLYVACGYVAHQESDSEILVYDLHNPARPREVGHFDIPNDPISGIAPLPGGRVLVTGTNLYVLAMPRSAG